MPIRAILSLWPCCFVQLDAKILCLARHHHRVGGSADQDLEMGRRKGLGQVVPRAGAERLDAARDAGIAGHDDDNGVLVGAERGLQDLETRDLRHVEIDEDDVELAPADHLEGFLAAADQRDVVAVHLKNAGAALAQGALVINDEHADARLDFCRNRERIAKGWIGRRLRRPIVLSERVRHRNSWT